MRAAAARIIAELRTYLTSRPSWEFNLWMGSLAVAFGIIALAAVPFELWPLLIFAVSVASAMGFGTWALSLRRRLASAQATVRELNTEAMRLHLLLTECQIADVRGTADTPALRVVQPSDEVSDFAWPAIAREIEHDDLTALMRATEEPS